MALAWVFSLPAGAALIDEGNGLIRDTRLGVWWLQDASLGGTGSVASAVAWAESLEFEGLTDWRLPSVDANADGLKVVCGSGVSELACRDNELGYMYYWNLTPDGDTPPTDPGTDLTGDQDPFEKIQPRHWALGSENIWPQWYFDFTNGSEAIATPGGPYAAWAVHPVPVPAAVWLLAPALVSLGVVGWRRRKAT